MDDLLVEFCRNGTLKHLVLGMRPPDVVKRLGKPGRLKNGNGDECFQWYEYSSVQLSMRCFSRAFGIRLGPGRDLRLVDIRIDFSGHTPVTLPSPMTPQRPIASAASLRLEYARRTLAEHGIEMARDGQVLLREVDDMAIRVISGKGGFVSHISAGWRPGGWFYSEEDPAGCRV